jgi:hypothetical protein
MVSTMIIGIGIAAAPLPERAIVAMILTLILWLALQGKRGRRGGSELWSNLKKALEQGRFSLPDRDSLQADLVSCGYRYRSDGKLVLESKEDMRARGMPSPDEADALALCFTEPHGGAFPRSKNFRRDLSKEYQGYFY